VRKLVLFILPIVLLTTFCGLLVYVQRDYPRIQYDYYSRDRVEEYPGVTVEYEWQRVHIDMPDTPEWVSFLQSDASKYIFIGLVCFLCVTQIRHYIKLRTQFY